MGSALELHGDLTKEMKTGVVREVTRRVKQHPGFRKAQVGAPRAIRTPDLQIRSHMFDLIKSMACVE